MTRRTLPHWFVPAAWHFVTYRLSGTIPMHVLHRMRADRDFAWQQGKLNSKATPERRAVLHKQFFAAYDRYLDHDSDVNWLQQPRIASLIRGNLYYHNRAKYDLLAYCIMPNHVHVLLRVPNPVETTTPSVEDPLDETPDGNGPLAGIMHSLKVTRRTKRTRS